MIYNYIGKERGWKIKELVETRECEKKGRVVNNELRNKTKRLIVLT